MKSRTSAADEQHHYRAYGLSLSSVIPLPELPPATDPPDVIITRGRIEPRPEVLDHRGAGFWVDGDQACHFRQEAGAFLAVAGRELIVNANPEAPPEVVRLSILGPGLGLILQQRGTFALHGSAVEFQGGAVVFLGVNGAGKSTMAALMHARGHSLLCDDVTPLDLGSDQIRVTPSFPQIKLWPDSADTVGSAQDMPILHPSFTKRALRPTSGFKSESVSLLRIYVLTVADEILIETVPPMVGMQQLLTSWYGARFGASFSRSIDQSAHFKTCTRLAREVPMRVLRRPAALHEGEPFAAALEQAIDADLRKS